MRLALPIAIALLLVGLLAGCGGGSSSSTGGGATTTGPAGASTAECGGSVRVSGVPCKEAEAVLALWRAAPGCAIVGDASHASCRIHGYLCISARQGQKAAVSCAQPGKSILLVATE
jgi:hypothetical protein